MKLARAAVAASLLLAAPASLAAPGDCQLAPDAPTGFTVEAVSSDAIFVSWDELSPPTNCSVAYVVHRSTVEGELGDVVFSDSSTAFFDTGLAPETTYWYRLEADTSAGASATWPKAYATTLARSSTICSELPSAPTGLSAAALSSSEIGLRWDAGAPPLACSLSYTVFRGTRSDFTPSLDNQVASGIAVTYFTDSGLSPSTTHYYRVAAADAVGSTESTTVNATTLADSPVCAAAPPAPAGIKATPSSPSQINVSWSAVAPPAGCTVTYAIHRGTTASFVPSPASEVISGVSGTSYSDTGLTPSTTYHYVVVAVDAVGSTGSGTAVSATTPAVTTCTVVPPAPGGLVATATSSSQIELSWSAVTPPAGCSLTYALFRDTTSGFTPGWGNLRAPGITGTSYSDSGLAPSRTYYYLVQAVDSAGISANSSTVSATTQQAPVVCDSAPAAASGLTATALSPTRIDVSWNAVTPPPGCSVTYALFRSTSSDFGAPTLVASGLTSTSFSNTGLTPSTTYYYAVRASDSKGDSDTVRTSATTQSTVTCTSVPSAPAGVVATPRSPRQIDLSWGSVAPPSGCPAVTYSVYQSTTPGFAPSDADRVATNLPTPSYSSAGLTAATTYHFVVRAVDGAGPSPTSSPASATTPADVSCTAVPPAPLAVAATAVSPSQIDLSWGAVTPPTGCAALTYAVHRSTSGGFAPSDANRVATNLPSPSYSSAGLAASTTYHFVVRAVDAAGSSPASSAASATTRADASVCTAAPSAPGALVAVARSSSAVDVSWGAVTPPPGCSVAYMVHQGTSAGFTPSDANRVATNLSSPAFTATGLSPSTSYYFVVRAVDAAGASPDSARGAVTTQSDPKDFSAGGCSSFGAPLDATWTLWVLAGLARRRRGAPAAPGRRT